MIKPKKGTSFYLGDFSPYIHKLEELGLGDAYRMIGGLAVECWRRTYQNVDGVLQDEIASKDIDFIAAQPVVQKLDSALFPAKEGEDKQRNYREAQFDENTMREFILPAKDGRELKGQFLDQVTGLYCKKAGRNMGLSIRLPFDEKTPVSVLDPVSIFTAKLAVCCQPVNHIGWIEESCRNDEAHMNVLQEVIPDFLKDQTAKYKKDPSQPNPAEACKHLLGMMADNLQNLPGFVYAYKDKVVMACKECVGELEPATY